MATRAKLEVEFELQDNGTSDMEWRRKALLTDLRKSVGGFDIAANTIGSTDTAVLSFQTDDTEGLQRSITEVIDRHDLTCSFTILEN